MKIIVTGSLGHIGRPLATELVQKGHAVTVISSSAERQKDIEALGATAATGSLEDADFLAAAFSGADAVFAMVPPNYGEPDLVAYYTRIANNYAQAVRQSGIKHVVYLSSYGAHLDRGTGFILGAHHAENILNELPGIAITHLRPGYFYYNLYNFAGMIKGQGILGSNYGGDDKMILVDPLDIAAAAAEELGSTATGRKVRYIASDERTCNEVARILGSAIGKPGLQWMTFSNEQAKEGMEKQGMPAHTAANFIELGAALHSGALVEDYEQHRPGQMGNIKLEDFATAFAAAYNNNSNPPDHESQPHT